MLTKKFFPPHIVYGRSERNFYAKSEQKSDIASYRNGRGKNDQISHLRAPRILENHILTDPYKPIGHADEEIFFTQLHIWP